jgi:hypothetical protein
MHKLIGTFMLTYKYEIKLMRTNSKDLEKKKSTTNLSERVLRAHIMSATPAKLKTELVASVQRVGAINLFARNGAKLFTSSIASASDIPVPA